MFDSTHYALDIGSSLYYIEHVHHTGDAICMLGIGSWQLVEVGSKVQESWNKGVWKKQEDFLKEIWEDFHDKFKKHHNNGSFKPMWLNFIV